MHFVTCTYDQHAAAILDIFNDVIATSTAIYDYTPRPLESMVAWFDARVKGNFPVLGLEDDDGQLLGFASYATFRPRPAYKYSIEHSVYVHKQQRGKGLGVMLMQQLIATAREQNYHIMVGGIDAENLASIAFHEKLGFTYSGTIHQAGYKFGKWLDLAFYQLILDTPAQPMEG
jgi:L-amino acid N-acyltransferase